MKATLQTGKLNAQVNATVSQGDIPIEFAKIKGYDYDNEVYRAILVNEQGELIITL